ncbi:hypothetical protein, partial [Algoriphagus sp.]|uniref:hypothetical protein n=1 Tax=Algoriphagus sp. TaxID=1872435 RepID=UPI0025CE5305
SGLSALLLNKTVILKAIASKTNVLANIYSAVNTLNAAREFGGYALSLYEGTWVDLKQNLQKYRGNIIPAQLEVVDVNSFKSEYQPGEKVTVKVKMNAKSYYDEWKKAGYEVSWNLPPGNGQLDNLFSKTNDEGMASVQWTLPNQENAVVNLTAEVKDQEGDQFYGSPLNFQLNIAEKVDSLALYREAAVGTWDVIATNGGSPSNYEYVIEMRADGSLYAEWWLLYDNGDRYKPCCPWTRVPVVQEIDGRYHLNFRLNLWEFQDTDPLTYPPTAFNHYDGFSGEVSYACTKR